MTENTPNSSLTESNQSNSSDISNISNLLKGKNGIIFGLANDRSIATGIAHEAFANGANLILAYNGEILKKRVAPIAEKTNAEMFECDVTNEDNVEAIFAHASKKFAGKIDFIVHSVAFANKEELKGKYYDTSKAGFLTAMEISCFSLASICKHASKTMQHGGSIITLTYLGAERVVPNYNVMGVAKAALEASVKYLATDLGHQGIRINAISAGPMRTLASSAIGDFSSVLDFNKNNAPMRRNVEMKDISRSALFLLSDLSSGVTGDNLHVDCGYHIVGIPDDIKDSGSSNVTK